MIRLILSRLVGAVGVLLALITIVFMLRAIVPGDPAKAAVGANASQEVVNRERHVLGLDRPLPEQYITYVADAARLDFGQSARSGRPVRDDLADFVPATVELALFALLLAIAGGLLLGLLGATAARGSGLLRLVLVIGAAAPSFLLSLALIYVFYYKLSWLPVGGLSSVNNAPGGPTHLLVIDGLLTARPDVVKDALAHLVLPGLALAFVPAVAIGRVLRSSLLDVYRTDYIRTAEAKGLHPLAILLRHALRNALSAPLTITGLQVGLLLSGVVIVETIFSWPGIGLYTDQSIQFGDLTAIAGVTLVVGTAFVLVNLLVDIAQALADPRIRPS